MSDAVRELINYRLARAREMLADAELLLESDRLTSAANRIYYAMFYATTAMLATRGVSSSRHSGVIGLLHEHFVRPGLFPRDLAKHLSLAFEMRNDSDYEDFIVPDKNQVSEILGSARAFVAKSEELTRPAPPP